MKTIAISGGFDTVHVGHLRMMKAASDFAEVIVILNSDDWLERKKGYVFMPFKERKEIIEGFYCFQEVVAVDDSDDTVCEAILRIKPDFFGNGGDRKSDNVPEVAVCEAIGTTLLWNVGGNKIQSSSELVENYKESTDDEDS